MRHALAAVVLAVAVAVFAPTIAQAHHQTDHEKYYELCGPSDADNAIVFLQGGGWKGYSKNAEHNNPITGWEVNYACNNVRPNGDWLVYTIDYTSNRPWVTTRQWYGQLAQSTSHETLCVAGRSAGGHMALLLNVPYDPDCTATTGAPTRLTDNYTKPSLRNKIEKYLCPKDELGPNALSQCKNNRSPIKYRDDNGNAFNTPIIMGHYRPDDVVRIKHLRDFRREVGSVSLGQGISGGGSCNFVHAGGNADCQDVSSYYNSQDAFFEGL